MNIDNCRKSMVETKETPRLCDSKGNYPARRGRGQSQQMKTGMEVQEATQSGEPIEGTETPGTQPGDREVTHLVPTPEGREAGTSEPREEERWGDGPGVELAVDTEDDMPKEGERVDGVRVGTLVANTFNQLREVAERYDKGDIGEDQINKHVKPPSRAASKERMLGKVPGKKNQSPAKKKEVSNKDRQVQVVKGFQQMGPSFHRATGRRRGKPNRSSNKGDG